MRIGKVVRWSIGVVMAGALAPGAAAEVNAGPRLRWGLDELERGSSGAFVLEGLELLAGPELGEALVWVGPLRAARGASSEAAGAEQAGADRDWSSLEVFLGRALEVEPEAVLSTVSLDAKGAARDLGLETLRDGLPDGYGAQALVFTRDARGRTQLVSATNAVVPQTFGSTSSALGGVVPTGELVITEFMKDPTVVSDTRGEWVEIFNPGDQPINIEGYVLSDLGSNSHTLFNRDQGLWVPAGGHWLLAISNRLNENGFLVVDYRYQGFTLSNGADEIVLSRPDGTLVDSVIYDDGVSWPDAAGQSISLDRATRDAVQNDDPSRWCQTDRPIHRGNSDTGTPGFLNDSCGP